MKLILANRGQEAFEVRRGERNVQLAFAPVLHAMLDETLRRAGGFGSTGR